MNLHLPIDQSNPLVPLHAPHSIECPVFCIPGAGASVTSFVEFVNALGEQWPVYGLQPRGIDMLLRNKAKGYSLQPLYPEVPANLRGYVELVYDLNNHPSFKLIEPLLYKSRYYDPASQSSSDVITRTCKAG